MSEHVIDILINRIVDKIETPAEWAEFRALAATEPSAWELLAEAQHDNDRLAQLAREATDFADEVRLPDSRCDSPAAGRLLFRQRMSAAAGWAAAAALLLAWILIGPAGLTEQPEHVQTAGFRPAASADDSLQEYLQRGRADGIVLGEVEPKMLIDTRPLDGDTVEVVFVRQIIERRQMPSFVVRFEGAADDEGNVRTILVKPVLRGDL